MWLGAAGSAQDRNPAAPPPSGRPAADQPARGSEGPLTKICDPGAGRDPFYSCRDGCIMGIPAYAGISRFVALRVFVVNKFQREGVRWGEILGVGCTHRPLMLRPNEDWTFMLRAALRRPGDARGDEEPASWPPQLREELGNDWGTAAAARGRRFIAPISPRRAG